MLYIIQHYENEKKYKNIEKCISGILNTVKKELPKNLNVKIVNVYSHKFSTGIYRENGVYFIDLNLGELIHYFNEGEYLTRGFKEKISFKKFIAWAIFHELGHYKKHWYKKNYMEVEKLFKLRNNYDGLRKQENEADFLGLELWKKVYNSQLEFNFESGIKC